MRTLTIRLACVVGLLISLSFTPQTARADGDELSDFYYHSPIPLGIDAIKLRHPEAKVYLLGSVENQALDGVHVFRARKNPRVLRVDGSQVDTYPATLDFRVTATTMGQDFMGVEPLAVTGNGGSINDYLLGLKFKLKICRGLQLKVLKPASVNLIGVPSSEPYDERVYRVSFDTQDVPVDARIVLEVYDSTGERLTRFHLELL